MIHQRIPFCITLTKSGHQVPDELPNAEILRQHIQINPAESALRKVFDLAHRMCPPLYTDISPEIININTTKDLALHSVLQDQTAIYSQTKKEQQELFRRLETKYFGAFYQALEGIQQENEIKLGFDCRILTEEESRLIEKRRPILSLNNCGDGYGEKRSEASAITCPAEMIRDIRDIFSARFADIEGSVFLNISLEDSYVTQHQHSTDIPWLELAINRTLLENSDMLITENRIASLRDRFENIFVMICKYYEWF